MNIWFYAYVAYIDDEDNFIGSGTFDAPVDVNGNEIYKIATHLATQSTEEDGEVIQQVILTALNIIGTGEVEVEPTDKNK